MNHSHSETKLDKQVWLMWAAKNARRDRERARKRWKLFGAAMACIAIVALIVFMRS
jgi:hypothetical protein